MSVSLLSRTSRQPLLSHGIPFLYQTRTILRCYSQQSDETAAYVPTHSERDQERSTESRTPGRRPRARDERRNQTKDYARATRSRAGRPTQTRRDGSARTADNHFTSGGTQHTVRDRERKPDVPFDGPVPSKDPNVRLQGSTMTPKELAIFENLFRSKQAKPAEARKPGEHQNKAPNLAKVVPDFPAPLRALADEAQVLHSTAEPEAQDEALTGSGLQPSEAAERYLIKTKARMDKVQYDAELWQIMRDEIFHSVKELKLDDPSAQSSMKPENVEALTRSLPNILLYFMSLMQNKFPGSSYGLVLLPTLKKLGPSAFALGATTDLYNEHMQILLRQYTDLDSIAETLTEMDKEVYEFNTGTQALLISIFQRERAAQNGRMGPGMQAFWTTDRKMRALEKLRRWEKVVQEQVRSAAIKTLKEKEYSIREIAEEIRQRELEAYGQDHVNVAAA